MVVIPPQGEEGAVGLARVRPAGFPGEEGPLETRRSGTLHPLTRAGPMGEVKQACQGPRPSPPLTGSWSSGNSSYASFRGSPSSGSPGLTRLEPAGLSSGPARMGPGNAKLGRGRETRGYRATQENTPLQPSPHQHSLTVCVWGENSPTSGRGGATACGRGPYLEIRKPASPSMQAGAPPTRLHPFRALQGSSQASLQPPSR